MPFCRAAPRSLDRTWLSHLTRPLVNHFQINTIKKKAEKELGTSATATEEELRLRKERDAENQRIRDELLKAEKSGLPIRTSVFCFVDNLMR